MAKKQKKSPPPPVPPAEKAEPLVFRWVKAETFPTPQPLQFTARELGYLDTLLTVELSLLKPESINKTMRDTHQKIRAEFKLWWDKLEAAGGGTCTITTSFATPGASGVSESPEGV